MNKKTLKVLISLALLFVFTSNVNASLRCNSDDEEVIDSSNELSQDVPLDPDEAELDID